MMYSADLYWRLRWTIHVDRSFEKGKIDIRINGNGDKGFAKEISGNLTKWTGIDWIVNSVEEEGEETLDQKREREDKERITMTKSTPEMEKVLKAFPNADLKSVKDSNEWQYKSFV